MTQQHKTSLSRPVMFWLGTLAIMAGVVMHLPMFVMSAAMHYRMAGMPMDNLMLAGMGFILAGTLASGYGLFPKAARSSLRHQALRIQTMDEAPLTSAHWKLCLTLMAALIIDVMKPATLGFVVPGTMEEYGLSKHAVAILPLIALLGTALGSAMWGFLADAIGRRASVVLAALMFISTAICGAMPTFSWNVFMCFMMGLSAGGLLPVTFALLAEMVPAHHRGWLLVLLGGVGSVGGYIAASGAAALLEPHFGWRILWLLGMPTGAILILLNRYIPESPRFLLLHGRTEEAAEIMASFGAHLAHEEAPSSVAHAAPGGARPPLASLFSRPYTALTFGLILCAAAWGLVNFGFLLWLPTGLRQIGLSVSASDAILAKSALIAFPGVLCVAWLYHRWSTKLTLVLFTWLTTMALGGFTVLGSGLTGMNDLLTVLIVLLLVSSGGVISILIPYSAETYPVQVRGTGAGLIAASSKLGGVLGVGIGMAMLTPGLVTSSLIMALPLALSAFILGRAGIETRALGLEDIGAGRSARLDLPPAAMYRDTN